VQFTEIVGCDLRSVEHVTGRMTDARAAAEAGAASHYEVVVASAYANPARQLLSPLG
jgi:hypothetical protein